MRQKRKSVKLWIVLALVVSLAAVQAMQVMAEDGVEVIIPGFFEPLVRTLRATIPKNESHLFR